MKKKTLHHVILPICIFLLSLVGCGSDKNLNPEADLLLKGADPPTLSIDANPPLTRQTYFLFQVVLNDANLSMTGQDIWTVDSCDISYSLVSDPGQHVLGLPAEVNGRKLAAIIRPGSLSRVAVVMIEDSYVLNNLSGFVGTTDRAEIKAHLTFYAHRNYDGARKVLNKRFPMVIGDF